MPPTIRLTVITGPHKDKRFCLRGSAQCLVGRGPDCFVQLAGDPRDQLISRHHCELHVDAPCVHLTDLSSSNGTFLNGQSVPELERSLVDALADGVAAGVEVQDGDIITVGGTSLRANIVNCPPPGIAPDQVWAAGQIAKKDCNVDC